MIPNLFIVGAPKCGTSSLFDWLIQHPDVRGSSIKEPFFFTDTTHPLSRRPNFANDGLDAFETFFNYEDSLAVILLESCRIPALLLCCVNQPSVFTVRFSTQ